MKEEEKNNKKDNKLGCGCAFVITMAIGTCLFAWIEGSFPHFHSGMIGGFIAACIIWSIVYNYIDIH